MTAIPDLTHVSIHRDGNVADIRLNRPDALNALNMALIESLISAANWVKDTPDIRCVVLSGEGRTFCAGMDVSALQTAAQGGAPDLMERTHGIANVFQQAAWGWRECPVPVIAAMKGAAVGGGFQLAMGADIRIAHPQTKLSIMEMKWGLIPDMAGMALISHIASEDIARELTYTARIFKGEQAKDYGFVTHISDEPYADAMTLAHEIASKNPEAITAAKTLFNEVADARASEILLRESERQTEIQMSPNQIEAVKAELQKRPANFKNRAVKG